MSTICLYTQSSTLSKRWSELLSNDHKVEVCTEFEGLKSCLGDDVFVVFHDERELEHIEKELDVLHEAYPKKNTLVLRGQPKLDEGEELLSHDIGGYGNAYMSDDVFIQALEVIKSGNVWLYPELMAHLIKKINKINSKNDIPEVLSSLSDREKEVALLISKGETNQMIADDLSISHNTVKLHIGSIFEKLGIKSRVALAILISRAD